MNTYAVILAGGIGSRFWPMSRQDHPKQFLRVFGNETLIQGTFGRLQGLIPSDHVYIVTNDRYVTRTHEQLPAIPSDHILAEPMGKNTAPAIMYAAVKLHALDPEAIMIVLPADHVIRNIRRFHEVLRVAIEAAHEPDALVTIGIKPTHPETGYGYIQFDGHIDEIDVETPRVYHVKAFAEKPNLETAERFIAAGDFLWNSGMFVWRVDSILHAIQKYLPELYRAFEPLMEAVGTDRENELLKQAYEQAPKISIDYGVMERAEKVYVVPGDFGWSDVGDWRAVYELSEKDELGNALKANAVALNTARCLVESTSSERLIALVGVRDLVVVDTDDALLVCHRDAAQDVKKVVDYLHAHQMTRYI